MNRVSLALVVFVAALSLAGCGETEEPTKKVIKPTPEQQKAIADMIEQAKANQAPKSPSDPNKGL